MCILCRLASYLRIKMSTEPINCHDRKKSQSGKLSKFETPVMTPWCNLSALEENVRWKCLTALKQASKCSGFGVHAALSRCAGYRPATGQQTRAKGAGVTPSQAGWIKELVKQSCSHDFFARSVSKSSTHPFSHDTRDKASLETSPM